MFFKIYLRVMVVFSASLLCKSEALLPPDAVTLSNLRVDGQGMMSVEITIEGINHTLNKSVLEVVLTNSDDTTDVVVVSLANATWSHNVTDFISSTISGLKQDVKYFLILQVNESVISNRYTLVTTGLQSITANMVNIEISCAFLPGSRADGCMVEWRPMNGEEAGYIILSRDRNENRASAHLQSLIPGIFYQVRGFGLLEGERLHTFPITLSGGLTIQRTDPTRAPRMITESSEPSIMLLVITLSAALAVILVTIFVLICIIVVVLRCQKKSHTRMPEDTGERELPSGVDIPTSSNICYGDILEKNLPLKQGQKKRDSLHLYDDVIALAPLEDNVYANVDAETGLPTVPKPVDTPNASNSAPICERACLPLKGITPLASSNNSSQKDAEVKKSQRSLGRASTFQHKSSRSPMAEAKFATLSVVLEATDYEMPIPHIEATAI